MLAYWGGLTAAQIAQRADVPLGTAKSRLRLGLARLRDEMSRSSLCETPPFGGFYLKPFGIR